ncbi:sporulation related protein [Sulfuritortus calidifontis]|uniref:Sporulation related protein n=1 Tax=Sulfuritortus calidifontis TaxID=1914471 RepID=A0A4R3JT86_9PROT|nr:SPOR domain-containing protein [Sulfuritortus calidifontis]TCS69445.1 sporulation related protein [Sulfuritortus calidifontis]
MARYGSRSRKEAEAKPRARRGGLFTGVMVGLVLGLVIAAGVAAYIYLTPIAYKGGEAKDAKPAPAAPEAKPAPSAPPTVESSPKPAPDYTFYHILQGGADAKTPVANLPRELYWLQVAALKSPADADRLKAKLALLGMDVAVQKVDSAGVTLHRVRVGPFKTEDAAIAAMDTLAANQFEPRLIKEATNTK